MTFLRTSFFILSLLSFALGSNLALAKNIKHSKPTTKIDNFDDSEFSDEVIVKDPFEKMNRKVYKFNHYADKYAIRPITVGYRSIVPKGLRKVIKNIFSNINEPITIINSALQGDINYSVRSFGRFMVNSTLGLGGTMRLANDSNRKEDFGQTLGKFGAGPGAYIVLPILGPSDTRDTIGYVADIFSDPLTYAVNPYINSAISTGEGINKRDDLLELTDEVERNSLDPYVTYRSLYLQRRAAVIKNEDDLE